MRTPEEVVADLAPQYTTWKASEKSKEKLKKEFFEAITENLKAGDLAERVITVEAKDEVEAEEIAEKKNPLWTVDDLRLSPEDEGVYEVILIENPQFLPFTIEHEGKVWGRQIRSGSIYIDDEALQGEDPDFWLEISEIPQYDLLSEIVSDLAEGEFYIDDEGIEKFLQTFVEKGRLSRTIKPLEDLTPEQLANLQKYTYEGKPSLSLPAPTNVPKE